MTTINGTERLRACPDWCDGDHGDQDEPGGRVTGHCKRWRIPGGGIGEVDVDLWFDYEGVHVSTVDAEGMSPLTARLVGEALIAAAALAEARS